MFHICKPVPDRPAQFLLILELLIKFICFVHFITNYVRRFFSHVGKNVVQFDTAVSRNKAGNVHLTL